LDTLAIDDLNEVYDLPTAGGPPAERASTGHVSFFSDENPKAVLGRPAPEDGLCPLGEQDQYRNDEDEEPQSHRDDEHAVRHVILACP
jgi:hypothetical protein